MAEKAQRYNLLEMKSVKDVKPEDILSQSEDGKTIVTVDGLKVSDQLIADAKRDAAANRAAAAAAVGAAGAGLSEEQVRLIAREEAEKAIASAKK